MSTCRVFALQIVCICGLVPIHAVAQESVQPSLDQTTAWLLSHLDINGGFYPGKAGLSDSIEKYQATWSGCLLTLAYNELGQDYTVTVPFNMLDPSGVQIGFEDRGSQKTLLRPSKYEESKQSH